MQSRQPPPSAPRAPGPRCVAPPLALLLCLALQGAGAVPAGPREPEQPDYGSWWVPPVWPPRLIEEPAAQAALHFLNFRVGSPSALRELFYVQQSVSWVNLRHNYESHLVLITKRYTPKEGEEEAFGECSAKVIFDKEKPRPAVNITCAPFMDKSRQQEDYLLYKYLKRLKNPLGIVNIPDGYGHIDPSLRPMWDLAYLGSSYVMWEKATCVLRYKLAQLTGVKQWKTDDGTIDFDYTVLLHEFSTQETIPCRIHLVWYPGKPLKVKYHCQGQQTSDETSRTEEGSAVVSTELSNF